MAGEIKAPDFEVLIDGTDIVAGGVGISYVTVETSVEKADSFTFEVINAFSYEGYNWLDQYFSIGKSVEIKFGYRDALTTVFKGLITSLNFDLPQDGAPKIVVGGMDKTILLTKGVKSRSWADMTHSDVVSQIVQAHGMTCTTESTGTSYKIIEQSRVTDYQFLNILAEWNGFEFFLSLGNAYFRKLNSSVSSICDLTWGQNMFSFSPTLDVADQVCQVEVRAVDELNKQTFVGTSGTVTKVDSSATKDGPQLLQTVCGSQIKEYVYENAISQAEAKKRADAILNRRSMDLVTGTGQIPGDASLLAGKYVKINGLGTQLSRIYYLTSVTHTINDYGYRTTFTVGGNAI